MPLYAFENKEREIEIDVYMPVDAIVDEIVLKRRTVPDRVGIVGLASAPTQGDKVLAGYKQLEDRGQLAGRSSEFTPEQIKTAWADETT